MKALAVVTATNIAVWSIMSMWCVCVGHTWNVPDSVMSLTLIAAGSSVPDAIASLIVVREGMQRMSLLYHSVSNSLTERCVCMCVSFVAEV